MKSKSVYDRVWLGLILATTGLSTPALAQTAADNKSPAPRPPAQSHVGLEEIVVTAQKRAENVQTVPIAITAYSAEMLEKRNMSGVADIARGTPNLQFTPGAGGTGGGSSLFIRGIGQFDFITTTEPGVGTYVDGVYLARTTGAAVDIGDVERIEVLRGPQGTLFGRNTIGGALNITTIRPKGEFEGSVEGRIGSYARRDARFMLNIPIVGDTLAARVNFMTKNSSGYDRDTTPDGQQFRFGRERTLSGRAVVQYLATDNLKFLLSGDFSSQRGTVTAHGLVDFKESSTTIAFNQISPLPIGPQYVVTDLNKIQLDVPPTDELDTWGTSLVAEFDTSFATIKAISAYRYQKQTNGQDYDGTPTKFLNQFIRGDQWQFSQELQMVGKAFDNRLNWAVGGYFFTEKGQFNSDVSVHEVPVLIDTGNKTDSLAFYGQATYAITDRINLTAGARWTTEKKFIDVETQYGGVLLIPETKRNARFNAFSPKAAIDFQVTPNLMLYGSVSRGFRSGGFNGRPFAPPDLTSYAPEETTSYEAGFKSQLFDRKVRFNVAGFYNDYTDIQVTATTLNARGDFIVTTGNAAKAKIRGFEVELEARPVQPLHFYGAVSYTANSLEERPGFSFGARTLPYAPKWNVGGGAEYTADLGEHELIFAGDASYRSSALPQFNPAPASTLYGYTLFNGNIAFQPKDARWKIMVYGKNLSNKRYRTYAQTAGSGDITVAWFGPPREVGVSLSYKF